jgi:hypothetical protein
VRKQLATDIPGAEWRKRLDAAKLKACGFHPAVGELHGKKLAATIEFSQALGNRNLSIRSLAPRAASRATS